MMTSCTRELYERDGEGANEFPGQFIDLSMCSDRMSLICMLNITQVPVKGGCSCHAMLTGPMSCHRAHAFVNELTTCSR